MKKEYIEPNIVVVCLNTNSGILNASKITLYRDQEVGTDEIMLSRKHSLSKWGDDEDYEDYEF